MSAESFKRRMTAPLIPESSGSLEIDGCFAKLARKKLMLLIILVALISSCASNKAVLLRYNMLGLSSENIFIKGKDSYQVSDFAFKAKFDPAVEGSLYYYITIYRGVISKDFDLKTIWFDPQGQKVEEIETRHQAKLVENDPRWRSTIFFHTLPISSFEGKPGKWMVELYFDGGLVEKRSFSIVPRPEQASKGSVFQEIRIAGARVYVDIPIVKIGDWNVTPIMVPAGSVVAVLAQGELRDKYERERWRVPPWSCLGFKIGQGPVYRLRSGADATKNAHNMNVIQVATAGSLSFLLNPKYPERKEGAFTATVLV